MSSEWHKFLKLHKGKGLSIQQLSKKYCNKRVSQKVGINIREGKYSSHQQAIAVAYSQVRKMYPSCRKFLERSSKKVKRSKKSKNTKKVGSK